jgi:hypothetical protein
MAFALGIAGALISGCTATHQTRLATLHVRAVLESTHLDANGHMRTLHSPLTGKRVIATSRAGDRLTAVVDRSGRATIRLAADRYRLTLSERDVCYPSNVTLQPGKVLSIDLPCAAP